MECMFIIFHCFIVFKGLNRDFNFTSEFFVGIATLIVLLSSACMAGFHWLMDNVGAFDYYRLSNKPRVGYAHKVFGVEVTN